MRSNYWRILTTSYLGRKKKWADNSGDNFRSKIILVSIESLCSGLSNGTKIVLLRLVSTAINAFPILRRREDAIDHLVEIMKMDRAWNEEAARKQLIKFFDAMSPTDDATIAGRRKMSAVLFS